MTAPDKAPEDTETVTRTSLFKRVVIACASGALGPLAFSPNNMWLLGFLSVMGLYTALKHASPRQGAVTGWFFGLGFFGVGASWVFVSINVYGNASELFAGFLTAVFVAGLALFFAIQGWLLQRFFDRSFYMFSFSALWVLMEWFRGWFLTGFPWLYLGYPHINSSFSGLAPIFGVLGISLVVALTGAAFGEMYLVWKRHRSLFIVAGTLIPTGLFIVWIAAGLTGKLTWVQAVPGESIDVALVQGNIDQNMKFDAGFRAQNLQTYETLSEPVWEDDLILWPETAIPFTYQENSDLVRYFSRRAGETGTTLVSGIFGSDENAIYNSIVSLGAAPGIYHKQKLVPFGEYAPPLFSIFFQLFNLPMSSLSPGPSDQGLLNAGSLQLAPFICYEVVYPDFVRRNARDADFLVTISNDTWFGASWGPLQHLEMAAMRALENGRYMVRATNNGVSAIIDEKGRILARTGQFQAEVLRGEVQVFSGRTPFSWWGSWAILLVCAGLLVLAWKQPARLLDLVSRIRKRQGLDPDDTNHTPSM